MIEIKRLDTDQFSLDSLRGFNRHQTVKYIYKLADSRLTLTLHPFEETWSQERKKEKAAEMISGRFTVFCAYDKERIIGEIMLVPELDLGRMIIDSLHVSEEYRRKGIGKALFETAKAEAGKHGAKALYLSACSAQETIDFYLAMGCRVSPNPIQAYADREPFDIQMECPL